MSISKREGSPFWWYDFTIGGVRFRGSTETEDKATAKAVEGKLRTDAVLGKHLRRKPRMTMNIALEKYWNEHGQYLPSAWDVLDSHFMEFNKFFGKNTYIDEIGDTEVSNYVTHILATPVKAYGGKQERRVSPATVNRKLDTLSSLLNRARNRWGVEVSDVRPSKHKLIAAEARTRWITPEQAEALIMAAAPHIKDIIRFALLTGLRLENILGLRWEQINMQSRIMTFRVKSKLPGGKLHELDIIDQHFDLLMRQGPAKSGYVFKRHFKGRGGKGGIRKPEPLKQVRKAFLTACKKAGIADFRFHDLRHTAASWMIQNGVELDVVQRVLGHSNIRQTQKYAHRKASAKTDALNTLARSHIRHNKTGDKNAKSA